MTIYEGTIIPCDEKGNVHRILVEEGGKVLFAGDELPKELAARAESGARKIDLGKSALLPSFADAHLHFSSWSFFNASIDLREAESNEEVLNRLAAANEASRGKKGLIIAFGISPHSVREGRLLSREDIDRKIKERPLIAVKYDGHACVCNSAMLAALPPEIRGLRGWNAETGLLTQEAFFRATDFATGSVSPLALIGSMLKAYDRLGELGIGMIHPAEGIGFPRDLDVDLARIVAKGIRSPLRTRVFFQTMDIDKVLRRKLPRIGGCFATALDGCFGSEDAALLEPYSNRPGSKGILYYEQGKLENFCVKANRAGLQISMHAIGHAAFRQAVRALGIALKDCPRPDHRHIIIHACLCHPADLEECARLKIGISAQSAFIDWPQEPDSYLSELLGERASRLNMIGTMRRLGIRVALGSDAPCTLPNPFEWLRRACAHPDPGESVSVMEALRMMTSEAAYLSFDEGRTGSLEAGKSADMVVASGNPLECPVGELEGLRVEQLILAGRPYRRTGSVAGSLLKGLLGFPRLEKA